MALIVNIGTIINVSVIKGDKGSYYLADSGTLGRDINDEFLSDKEKLAELLEAIYMSHPDLKSEELLVSLDYGSGIEYRTVKIPKDSLLEYDYHAAPEEVEEYFMDIFRSYQPAGLDQLYDRYSPCLMSSSTGEQEVALSLAFLPQPVVDSIISFADANEIILRGIYPFSYGIYNALDSFDKLVFMDLESSYLAFSKDGLLVWFKDGTYSLEEESIKEYLFKEATLYFPIDPETTKAEEITAGTAGYYSHYLSKENRLSRFSLSAIGCMLPPKQLDNTRDDYNNIDKGGTNSVTRSLRKLFKKE